MTAINDENSKVILKIDSSSSVLSQKYHRVSSQETGNEEQSIIISTTPMSRKNEENIGDEPDGGGGIHSRKISVPKKLNKMGDAIKEEVFIIGHNISNLPDTVKHTTEKITDKIRHRPTYDPFTRWSLLFIVISTILYLSDYISDILVAIQLSKTDDARWWFILTILLIVIPLIIVNLFSIYWFHQDHQVDRDGFAPSTSESRKGMERWLLITLHLLFIGPLARNFYIIYCGYQERPSKDQPHPTRTMEGPVCFRIKKKKNHQHFKTPLFYYALRKYYERDATYLGLIEGFIQDGPQLILQIYILAVRYPQNGDDILTAIYQIVSVLLSLISLSWSLVAYEQAVRWVNPEKRNMNLAGAIFQFVWRFLMIASRVLTISIFTTFFQFELFVFLGLHWLLMTLWILMMGTNFCGSNDGKYHPVSEVIYNIVMGWVCIFDFIHLKDGPTRWKRTFYYVITFTECIILMSIWYNKAHNLGLVGGHEIWSHSGWFQICVLSFIPTSFLVSITSMTIYYLFFHPEGTMPNIRQNSSLI